jgi:hypothetical protein
MASDYVSCGGRAPRIAAHHVVALYEQDTGAIRRLHTVTVFEGADAFDEAEFIQMVKTRAREAGHDPDRLGLAKSSNPEHGHRPHRIEVTTGSFVPLACETRGRRK